MSVLIRPAKPEDFPSILPLLQQLWPDRPLDPPALEQIFIHFCTQDPYLPLTAESQGGDILAFGSCTLNENLYYGGLGGYLTVLVVDEAHRSQQVGRRMMDEFIRQLQKRGCLRFELDSALHRTRAHAFYENLGFIRESYLFSMPL